MTDGILQGIRVLDLASGIAGRVAALLLAESGADVVKVESSEAAQNTQSPGRLTWDRSKRSVGLDVETADGREQLEALLSAADVVIHEYGPTKARDLGLDDAALAERHPTLVACSVLAWPANHPDADRPVDELLAMARLGICDEQLPMDREGPVFIRFPLGSWGAVYLAAAGVIARLMVRLDTGRGGPAHTSLVQGALVPMGMHWARSETPSVPMAVGMPKHGRGSQATLVECSDGVWVHLMKCPDGAPLMQKAFAEMGEANVAAANEAAGASNFGYPNMGANIVAMRTRPSQEWLADFWANDIAAQPAMNFGDVLDDEQSRANSYVIEVDDPREGKITVPGLPLTIDPPQQVQRPAPDPGQHTAEILAEWAVSPKSQATTALPAATASSARSSGTAGPDRRWPLDGLKVLDLGNYLAGPYAPMLLADLGADVIKLESTAGDSMRPTGWAFAGCQRGKRSIALNLKSPDTRPALEALVRWADVVHHNLRMPAARKLGLDYDTLREINPNLVYCHTSSYGPIGARADWPGYDQLFQAQCGWEALGAGAGNPPMWHRFGFMDHQCALSSVVATLLALYEQRRTGRAQAVAGSLLGAGVLTTSETYRRSDGSLAPFDTLDHDQTTRSNGARIVQVSDGWVAIAPATTADLDATCQIAGVSDQSAIAAALATRSVSDVIAALEGGGVPVEEVRENQKDAFFDSPANRAAGLVAEYRQADWGMMLQPGAMWFFGDLGVRLELAPPGLGEHTAAVLAEMGIDDTEVQRLVAEGSAVVS
ncbi:CoA transferase [Jatrophihabitans sp. DSM 45814]